MLCVGRQVLYVTTYVMWEGKPTAYGTRSHTATTPIHTLLFFSYYTRHRIPTPYTLVRLTVSVRSTSATRITSDVPIMICLLLVLAARCLPRRGAEAPPSSAQSQSVPWVWAKRGAWGITLEPLAPGPLAPARLASEDGGGGEQPCRGRAPSRSYGNRVGVHLSREGIPALGSRL